MNILNVLYNKRATPIKFFFGHFSLQILSTKQQNQLWNRSRRKERTFISNWNPK